jgi:hypothetical protein
LCRHLHVLILSQANGFIVTSTMLMVLWLDTRLDGLCEDSLNNMVLTMMKPSVLWSSLPPFTWYYRSPSSVIGLFINWTLRASPTLLPKSLFG